MSFIDRHVDDLTDGDYMEFCRMLQVLHNSPVDENNVPPQTQTQNNESQIPLFRSGFETENERPQNPFFGASFQQRIRQELNARPPQGQYYQRP